jgi:hypothetical protein
MVSVFILSANRAANKLAKRGVMRLQALSSYEECADGRYGVEKMCLD